MVNKRYEEMSPYELGETGDKEALKYLGKYLSHGTINERRLAASAVRKVSTRYKSEAKKLIPLLISNLSSNAVQVRQYCLKALCEFDLTTHEIKIVEKIANSDDQEYNRKIASKILENQNKEPSLKENLNNSEEGISVKPQETASIKDTNLAAMEEYKASSMIKLSPRSKDMYLYSLKNIEKYSANYAYTNHNFVIQNNKGEKCSSDPYFPVICILKNILMRGCPTLMSTFLREKLGDIYKMPEFEEPYTLISRDIPIWLHTIKGDDQNNDYPAITFFEELIPKYLPEHQYIQQLILPEVSFYDITLNYNESFINQQVDFYLPNARLVIEIDGQHHKLNDFNRLNDNDRDSYLMKFGVKTIRIDTYDIKNHTEKLKNKMDEILNHLEKYADILEDYRKAFVNQDVDMEKYKLILKASAIIRFQIVILSLLEKGKLKFNDKEWKICVVERDVAEFENLALEDLFLWIKNLSKLHKLNFKKPKVSLKVYGKDNFKPQKDFITIDFSLLKRWTDENEVAGEENSIYVRTDYFDKYNYFTVSTDKPIKYKIINDGKDSDVPALEFILENIFGFKSFNSGQLPVITNALKGEDTIGLLPTGGGKSLIYQYVALLQPAVNFIVAPIKSLMKDQMDNLDKRFITNSNFINSNQTPEEKEKVQNEYSKGKYQFIWISPERFQSQNFREKLRNINDNHVIGTAIIDEVHCLSEWGHDFRTSYLNLAKTIRKYCPKAQILGLTATASINVLNDILIEFGIEKNNVKTLPSFTRPELSFEIIKDDGTSNNRKIIELCSLLEKLRQNEHIFELSGEKTKSGLIFTRFVNKNTAGCYGLANYLSNKFKVDVRWYSGTCPKDRGRTIKSEDEFNKYKDEVQEDFQENRFPLLVATKAFGMGIDKSNIRYTIHHGIPESLEALYQEGGRAGRDKQPAKCYILLSEEHIGESYFNELFGVNSSVLAIKNTQEKIKYQGRDAMDNMFFWLSSVKDIEDELSEIMRFYRNYAKPQSRQLTLGQQLGLNKQDLERAIYKLSLIGVTDDWTIEGWNGSNPIMTVYFKNYNDKSIEEELLKYIRKYDIEFDIRSKSNADYLKIYEDQRLSFIEKAIKILLVWQYDNIAYHRRQSISTVYNQCKENANNPEELKRFMESYFKFSDEAFIFDYISENPQEYRYWFKAFYDSKGNIINAEKLSEIKASLRRFLESFKNNTGLNFISGLIYLLADDFENDDGKTRLEMAIDDIKSYGEQENKEIMEELFKLSQHMNDRNKENLSELLIQHYPNKLLDIYQNIGDNHSLNCVLRHSVNRLRNVKGGLL